jgi:cell wall assembly regulator SMI1
VVDRRVDALRGAIEQMVGEIDRVLTCDGMHVAVLVSRPGDEPELDDDLDDAGFICVTIGLSDHARRGEIPLAELLISADGAYSDPEIDGCAGDLARLASQLVAREGRVDDVLTFPWKHVFSRMNAVILTEYMITGPDNLYGIEPKVRLLAARPIFEDEARWMSRAGSIEANQQFRQAKVSWRDPSRPHVPAPIVAVKQSGDDMAKESIDIRAVWSDLEKWFAANKATATTAALRKGATDEDIATLEKAFGGPVPKDLAESLKMHNGRASIDRYALMPVKSIISSFEDSPAGKPEDPDREKKVKAVAWSKGWLPFAEDSGGNRFCIDLDPGDNGKVGQVIRWELALRSAGPTPYASFGAWLDAFRKDAQAGKCEVDDEGFVTRK